MSEEKRTEKVYSRVTLSLLRRFAIRAATVGLKPPAAVEAAITAWTDSTALAGDIAPRSSPMPATETTERKIATKDRGWHDLLDQILEGGTEADINGIQRNLEWGAAAVVHRGKKRRTGS